MFRACIAVLALGMILPTLAEESPAPPRTPSELYRDGARAFRNGDIDGSVRAFDALIRVAPGETPRLWQRGISLYYARRLEDCVEQFETHRTVNPHDVENATWHYLCVAALDGPDAARERFFPARDARVPLMAVHGLYAGKGSVDAVFDEVDRHAADPMLHRAGSFYGHLYVALWFESQGDAKRTREHLERALDGPRIGHYMEDVARVHLERITSGRHWANGNEKR